MSLEVDASDLSRAAADFRRVGRVDVMKRLTPAISKGALNIKTAMKADFKDSDYFAQVGRTVTYDLTARSGSVEAEIGPTSGTDKGSGALANIAYFGGAKGGGGTVRDPEVHLKEEESKLEAAVDSIVDDIMGAL